MQSDPIIDSRPVLEEPVLSGIATQRFGRSPSVYFGEFYLRVRCDALRWGVELNVNSLSSSSRERRTVIPEL